MSDDHADHDFDGFNDDDRLFLAAIGAEYSVTEDAAPADRGPVACPRCDFVDLHATETVYEGSRRGPLQILDGDRVVHEHGAMTRDEDDT